MLFKGMDRKTRIEFVAQCYSYGSIESALAKIFGADEEVQRGALRGRLKHLGRLGWPGIGQGKGQRILYSYEQAAQLLVALTVAELGIDPTVIVRLLQREWDKLVPWIVQATDAAALAGNPVLLTLYPRMLSGAWNNSIDDLPSVWTFRRFDRRPKEAGGTPIESEPAATFLDWCTKYAHWGCCYDLTNCLKQLQAQLDRDETGI